MGRPVYVHAEEPDVSHKAEECAWQTFARRLGYPESQSDPSTSAATTAMETDVDAVLDGLLSNAWPVSARRQAAHSTLQRREPAERRSHAAHLTWSDALEQFPLLDSDPNRVGRLRLMARRTTRDSDAAPEPWTPPPLPRAGPLARSSADPAPARVPPASRALREHMRRQMESTDVAQLANGTLHLAGMDQAATRAALSDAQQILQDLMLRLDERLFQENLLQQ